MLYDTASRASRPSRRFARVLLALVAALILLGSAMLAASASATLVKFEADWQDDGTILVVWETSKEVDSIAFFLYRAESETGPWDDYYDFEPATGVSSGATYLFMDDEVTEGITYWYYLEELDYDGNSSFHGPIMATEEAFFATSTKTSGTRSATSTPIATTKPGQDSVPTATRLYTNTPPPTAAGTSLPAQTQSPPQSGGTVPTTASRSGSPLVTTPTPVGGVPPAPSDPPSPEATATPEGGQIQLTDTPTVAEAPTLQTLQQTPNPSPPTQQLAAAPKEFSQPLLDVSAARATSAPPVQAPRNSVANPRVVLLLGISTLAAAAILGALALLIWRRRAR